MRHVGPAGSERETGNETGEARAGGQAGQGAAEDGQGHAGLRARAHGGAQRRAGPDHGRVQAPRGREHRHADIRAEGRADRQVRRGQQADLRPGRPGRRVAVAAVRPDGAVRAVPGHEQGGRDQAVPDRQGVPARQPVGGPRPVPRVLPVRLRHRGPVRRDDPGGRVRVRRGRGDPRAGRRPVRRQGQPPAAAGRPVRGVRRARRQVPRHLLRRGQAGQVAVARGQARDGRREGTARGRGRPHRRVRAHARHRPAGRRAGRGPAAVRLADGRPRHPVHEAVLRVHQRVRHPGPGVVRPEPGPGPGLLHGHHLRGGVVGQGRVRGQRGRRRSLRRPGRHVPPQEQVHPLCGHIHRRRAPVHRH